MKKQKQFSPTLKEGESIDKLVFFLLLLLPVWSGHIFAQDTRIWSTYYGGTGTEYNYSIASDAAGHVYIAGLTNSTTNIASGGFQPAYGGGFYDGYLVKFDVTTGNRVWATYYGGTDTEYAFDVTTDGVGNVYLAGLTNSATGIASAGGFQTAFGGGTNDAYLVKFDAVTGNRIWATYYGGTSIEYGYSVAADGLGNVYLAGFTGSTTNIATVGGFQNAKSGAGDAFLVKFDAATGNRIWATYYGGAGDDYGLDLATDPSGNVYLVGLAGSTTNIASAGGFQNTFGGGTNDAYLVKFDGATGNRIWATYYGDAAFDGGNSVATDAAGNNVYLAGTTKSPSGIASGGSQNTYGGLEDGFLVKFDATTGNRIWATYYGGTEKEEIGTGGGGTAVATDAAGNVYLAGDTYSTTNIASGGFDNNLSTAAGLNENQFVAKFDANGNRICATYYGSAHDEDGLVALDGNGHVYLSGTAMSASGIASPGAFQTLFGGANDAYLVKFTTCSTILTANVTSTNINCNGQCNGTGTASPSNGTGPYTYAWNTIPAQTTANATGLCIGSYTVTVIDSVGDTATATITITEPVALTANISASSNASCNALCNGSATVTPGGGTPGYTYLWNATPVQTTANATGLCAGSYTVNITDAKGCSTTQTVSITQPAAFTVSVSSTTGCGTNNGSAMVTVSGVTAPYTYSWSLSGGNNASATGLATGNYTCTITDANGCTQTQTVTVTNTPGPTATANATPVTIALGDSSQLIATGGGIYQWSPSTGLSCTSCANPSAIPLETTIYCVLVTDANGCTNSACITLEILCGNIFIPNAFSPNGDTENELECIMGGCIQTLHFVIYNRWGEQIFETSDPKICWDGTYKSKPLNSAVFVYYLEATLTSGKKITQKGNVSLIK